MTLIPVIGLAMILTVEARAARKRYDATLAISSSCIERHGKTALSFAACPSMKRNTACDTLRILLEYNADPSQKDDEGLTPKDHAVRENRQDALKILHQFESLN